MNRRGFLGWVKRIGRGAVLGGLGLGGTRWLRWRFAEAATAPPAQHPLRPPGALPEPQLRAACTRCFLCAEVCPARCITFPSRIVGSGTRA